MINMNEEEFKDFKNYIIKYRNLTNDLANKCITPYMLEQFRGYNDRFDYEPDLFSKYDVPNRIDELQQRYKQLQNNWNELKKLIDERIGDCRYFLANADVNYEKENMKKFMWLKEELQVLKSKAQELEQGKDENN